MISRPEAIQRLLDLFDSPRYLEIGVDHGDTFKPLQAIRKVAVDPKFNFEFLNYLDQKAELEFYEVTSDVYFGQIARPSDVFDVIFLDGLHVAEQTVRDLLNAVMFLQPSGIIVIDDVIPNSYHSSLTEMTDLFLVRDFLAKRDSRLLSDQAWMGDIFKLPFFIQTFMQQFSYATISENHGQTVLWRRSRLPEDVVKYSLESIGRLDFKDFVKYHHILKLLSLDKIIKSIEEARAC